MNNDIIKKAENLLINAELEGNHDLEHILRVVHNAKLIADTVECDKEVVVLSALLHDIGRSEKILNEYNIKKNHHADTGAKIAYEFLKDLGYDKAKEVSYAVSVHNFSKGIIPETIEAKILQDADRLDAIGYVGVMRVFTDERGDINDKIQHFYDKLLKLKNGMHTEKGKQLAEKKHERIEKYIKGLHEEMDQMHKVDITE
ncbi:MAG: HD domain-containing protein [Thermotogota bacterium]